MRKIPKGCRARHDAIIEIARELEGTFYSGNKNTARDELLELEPLVAFAVLSTMFSLASNEARGNMARYFMEVA